MTSWAVEHGMVVRRWLGSEPEIVWIHGLGEQSASFDAVARHPLLAGFAHTFPDLPGYGRTPAGALPTDASLAQLADHLVAWLRTRPAAVLVGHSMGGVLATLIAEQVPVRLLVNVEGNLTRGDCSFSAEAARFTQEEFRAHGFATLRAAVFARGATQPALRGYHAALLAADPDVFWTHATDLVRMSTVGDLAPRFTALKVPSLYIAGSDGICITSRGKLDSIGARWRDLEPAGHWPFIDQPDAFATTVAELIAKS